MREPLERLELTQLTPEQVAPLEAVMTEQWPDTWRDLATSMYLTLLSRPDMRGQPQECAARAAELTFGLAQDLGGTQPYIPVGADLATGARYRRVIDLLGQRMSYKDVAVATELTESRVRQIERAWRHEQIAQRQGRLQLD